MKKKDNTDQPTHTDSDLFRQALDGVTPLASSNRVTHPKPPRHAPTHDAHTAPQPVQDALSDHGAADEPPTEFARSGVSRMTLRKLRRGHWPVEDSLDLHGLTTDDARKLLLEFLRAATQHGLRCVCVIHGKGWHTEGREGILKSLTRHWLAQCAEVLAFCEPPAHGGGGGAVWVLLRSGSQPT